MTYIHLRYVIDKTVSLELSNALLNGPIPATLGMLTSLSELKPFLGAIVMWLLSLTCDLVNKKLANLVIQGGYLTGTIPSELSLLPRLGKTFAPQHSGISSHAVTLTLRFASRQVFIDLSLNLLEGSIPQDLFWNTNLRKPDRPLGRPDQKKLI